MLNNQILIAKWSQARKLMRTFCRHRVLLYGPHCSGSKKDLLGDKKVVRKNSGKEAKRESIFFSELFLKLKKNIIRKLNYKSSITWGCECMNLIHPCYLLVLNVELKQNRLFSLCILQSKNGKCSAFQFQNAVLLH